MAAPRWIRLTPHAQIQAERRRIALEAIERAVISGHSKRRRNPGPADWRAEVGGIVVLYDWPLEGDRNAALVRSLWRR
jgi:hypothetical protein